MIRFLHAYNKKVRAVGLVTAVILCFITSAVTLGFVRFMIGMNDSTRSNLERMVAQTAVSNAVNELEIIEYDKLASEPRQSVAGMGNVNIDREIIVTGETVNEVEGKKKDAIINIYRNGESDPILTLTKTLSSQDSSNIPKGTILPYSGDLSKLPHGWDLCDGKNGNPDLQGRFLIGSGDYIDIYGNTSYLAGAIGGERMHQLTADEMASHSHALTYCYRAEFGNGGYDWGMQIAKTFNPSGWVFEDAMGGGGGDQPHNNLPPYYVVHWIIKK